MANQTCNPSIITQALGITATGPRTVIVPADPIIWDAETSYEYLTLVASTGFAKAYISKKDVPAGTPLTDGDYWIPAADFNAQISNLQKSVDNLTTDLGEFKNDTNQAIDDFKNDTNQTIDDFKNDVNQTIDDFKNDVNQCIDDVNTGFLGVTINSSENTLDFLYTSNFENITRVKSVGNPLSSLKGSDWANFKKIGSYYYIFTNEGYAYTQDFSSFKTVSYNITWPDEYTLIWGITPVPGSNHLIACHTYSGDSFKNRVGATTFYFKPFIIPYTLSGPVIEFGTPSPVNFTGFVDNTTSVIDIDVMYDGTYHVAVKDETTTALRLFNAENISALISGDWVEVDFMPTMYGCEAPKFVQIGKDYSIMASEYLYSGNITVHLSGGNTSGATGSQNKPVFFPNPTKSKSTVFCKMNTPNRHLGIIPVDSVILDAFDCVEVAQTATCKDNTNIYLNNVTCTYNGPIIDGARFTIAGTTTKVTFNITDAHPTGGRVDRMAILMYTSEDSASCKLGTGFTNSLANKEICATNSASVDGYKLQAGKIGEILGYGTITTMSGLS